MENNSGNPIFVLGQEFLLDLANFMGGSIGGYLQEKWGDSWFDQCVLGEGNRAPEQIGDLSFLLKQILDLNNQNFRVAFAMSSFGMVRLEKPHLAALEQIRKSRNLWAHPNRTIKFHDLHRLAFNIQAIVPKTEPLAHKCSIFLQTEENQDQLTKIAALTEINQLYRNQSEYRSEIGRSLKSFADRIEKIESNEEVESIYTAQNHLLKNLWGNWLRQQALFYSLLWDSLLDKRDPRTGARLLSDSQLLELRREIDTDGGLREFEEFAEQLRKEIGAGNCECEFCKTLDDEGLVSLKEESHLKMERVPLAIEQSRDYGSFLIDKESGGLRPNHVLLIATVCAAKSGVSPDEVWDRWNFDILNPLLSLNSEAFDNHEVLCAAIRLVAIRNGIDVSEANSWNLD